MWAVGCIYAELLSLRPIFKGDEAKLDSKKTLPFQRDQMGKICEVLGPVKRMSPHSSCNSSPIPLSYSYSPSPSFSSLPTSVSGTIHRSRNGIWRS